MAASVVQEPLKEGMNIFSGGQVLLSTGIDVEHTNFIFVRIAKTASTTGCGVTRRIAAHHNINGVFDRRTWMNATAVADPALITWRPEPALFADHGALDAEDYGGNFWGMEPAVYPDLLPSIPAIKALQLPTFLWTVVRNPAGRAMSNFYYAWRGKEDLLTLEDKLIYLATFDGIDHGNVEFRFIRPSADATLDTIFSTYGFIGVLERFDESLVVLARMLKVPLSEMLYLPSKEDGVKNEENVTIIKHPSIDEEPQVIQDILNGRFQTENELDYQLLDRANKTLSEKIEQLGLERHIAIFKDLLARSQEECDVPGQELAPIADLTECYYSDQGCNYKCFDKFDAESRASCEWCD